MLWLNDNYSIKQSSYYGWELHSWHTGKDKKGREKKMAKITYYSTIKQTLNAMLDMECGKCKKAEELISLLKSAEESLLTKVEKNIA